MEDYTYQTSSNFTYIGYFKKNPVSTWNVNDFVKSFDVDESIFKRTKLEKSYFYCLNCIILQDEEVPKNIKEYIKRKHKTSESSPTESSSNTTQNICSFVNTRSVVINNNSIPPPSSSPSTATASQTSPQTATATASQTATATTRKRNRDTDANTNISSWDIQPPSGEFKWVVNGIDVCDKFYSYQNSVKNKFVEMQGYIEIENSLYDLLALSGILLLQKDTEHLGIIKNHFSGQDLKSLYVETKSVITSGKVNFNQDLYFSVKDAIDSFEENEDDLEFSLTLLNLCKTADEFEARAIKAIVYLFPEHISVQNRKLSEAHLSTSIVHPIIRSMFSGRNDISHCSNIHQTNSSRPDYKVDKYMHYQYYATPVFGEMKIAQYSNNKLLITDLYRIAIFMKNEIDEKNLDLTIGFQVVGLRICFYAMNLSPCGLYKFVELCSLQLPKNIDDLRVMILLLEPISNIMGATQLEPTLSGPKFCTF